MTVREIVKACAKDAGFSLTELAETVGMSQGNLSRAISRGIGGNEGSMMRVSTLIKLLDAVGAEIYIQSKSTEEYYLDGYSEVDEDSENLVFPHL